MSEKKQNNLHLTVGPEDSVSFGQATMLGIQHVLAMDVYVVPVIIASIIGISTAQTSSLIQATFIAAGLATIIQSHFCMRLPVAQGALHLFQSGQLQEFILPTTNKEMAGAQF